MNKSETTILGSGGGEELTLEEGWKRFEERKAKVFARARLRAQAKSRGVAMAVDAQTAENARARPESIRIATRDESGATRLSAPRRWAVDVGGSSAVGWMGWGPSGALGTEGLWFLPESSDAQVRHRYNPLDALKTEE